MLNIKSIKQLKVIGKGTFGVIYVQGKLAYKVSKDINEEIHGVPESFIKETSMLHNVYHPHIIRIEKIIMEDFTKYAYSMALCDMDLDTWVYKTRFNERMGNIKNILLQLSSSLLFLKNNNIIHRDITGKNVMCNVNNGLVQTKIIDFGMSILHFDKSHNASSTYVTMLYYRAPEILLSKNDVDYVKYDYQIDVWALGILLCRIITGNYPVTTEITIKNLTSNIRKKDEFIYANSWLSNNGVKKINVEKFLTDNVPPYLHKTISPQLIDLISKMLIKNPTKRITIDNVLKHQYINKASSTLPKYSCTNNVDKIHHKHFDETAQNFLIEHYKHQDDHGYAPIIAIDIYNRFMFNYNNLKNKLKIDMKKVKMCCIIITNKFLEIQRKETEYMMYKKTQLDNELLDIEDYVYEVIGINAYNKNLTEFIKIIISMKNKHNKSFHTVIKTFYQHYPDTSKSSYNKLSLMAFHLFK